MSSRLDVNPSSWIHRHHVTGTIVNTTPRRNNGISSNGVRDTVPAPLRIVFFSPSIVSDWHNPTATTVRAVMRALTAAGHDVLHLEERKNQPTVDLLRARGSSALRAFTERYADLAYRTYEFPTGLERTVWFVRQISTADALVILDKVPEGISAEAGRVQTRHLTKIRWSRDPEVEAPWADSVLSPTPSSSTVELGPAVERRILPVSAERSGILLVAYDDQRIADDTRSSLADLNPTCLTVGSVSGEHWTPISEVELVDRYHQARLAVVAGFDDDPFANARAWLPIASGCPAIAIRTASQVDALLERVSALPDTSVTTPALPEASNATVAAQRLVELVQFAQQRRSPRLA
jgi:hypothetical protein